MAAHTCSREVKEELGSLCRIGLERERLRHHVLAAVDRQGSYWDLVKQIELFNLWRHIRHDDFAAVRGVDQELRRNGFLFGVLIVAVLTRVSVRHHEVLLQINLDIFDFFFEKDEIRSSSDIQSTGLIRRPLVLWLIQSERQREDTACKERVNRVFAVGKVCRQKLLLRSTDKEVCVIAPEHTLTDEALCLAEVVGHLAIVVEGLGVLRRLLELRERLLVVSLLSVAVDDITTILIAEWVLVVVFLPIVHHISTFVSCFVPIIHVHVHFVHSFSILHPAWRRPGWSSQVAKQILLHLQIALLVCIRRSVRTIGQVYVRIGVPLLVKDVYRC